MVSCLGCLFSFQPQLNVFHSSFLLWTCPLRLFSRSEPEQLRSFFLDDYLSLLLSVLSAFDPALYVLLEVLVLKPFVIVPASKHLLQVVSVSY